MDVSCTCRLASIKVGSPGDDLIIVVLSIFFSGVEGGVKYRDEPLSHRDTIDVDFPMILFLFFVLPLRTKTVEC